jgi:hypothetical protein
MTRLLAVLSVAGVTGALAPSAVCERGASSWYADDPATVQALSDAVWRQTSAPLGPEDYGTGSARFDGEWWFGTYQMAAAGFAHTGDVARTRAAVDRLLQREVWGFDADAWGDVALDHLADDPHDHAVLGYLGVVLGLERRIDPDGPHAPVHDAVIGHLARRLRAGPLETYPGETYPVDNAAVLVALALHGHDVDDAVRRWEQAYVAEDGLVVQVVSPAMRVRGSGTALSAWFFAHTHPALARRLAGGLRDELGGTVAGFGAVREYRRGEDGPGDIDSGPLIDGWSISATGFSLGAARTLGDPAWFRDLYGTACLVGVPGEDGFLTGGPLGNAILFAMLTTPRQP